MILGRRKLEKIDLFLVFFSILLFGYSATELYRDMFGGPLQVGTGEVIGTIETFENSVKRKLDNSLIWFPAQINSQVFKGDWIFTGSDATTRISFLDGGSLEISPDSLVVLKRDQNNLDIQLTHGSVLANLKTTASISFSNKGTLKKISSSKGSFQISNKKNSGEVKVLEGLVEVNGQRIQKNEKVRFQENKVIKQISQLRLISPARNSKILSDKEKQISFRWDGDEKAFYELEVAGNNLFKGAIKHKIQGIEKTLRLPFVGKIFWKVTLLNEKDDPLTETSTFALRIEHIPELESPVPQAQIISRGPQPAEIEFSWADTTSAWTHFDFQLAKDINFKDIIREQKKGLTEVLSLSLESEGTFHWRVRGFDEDTSKYSTWTKSRAFQWQRKELDPAKPLTLSRSKIDYSIPVALLNSRKDNGSVPLEGTQKNLSLSWSPNTEASGYALTLADNKDLNKPWSQLEVKESSVNLPNILPGLTHFGVKPIFSDNRQTTLSQGEIQALFPAPKSLKVSLVNSKKELQWQELKSPYHYHVEYRPSGNNSKPSKSIFVEHASAIAPFQKKTFRWKVRMIDPLTKKEASRFSNENLHTYTPPIKKPASVEPPPPPRGPHPLFTHPAKKRSFLISPGASSFVVFRWKFDKPADSYEIEISRNEEMSQIYLSKMVKKKRKFVLKKTLPSGIYYYRIRGLEGDQHSDWSPTEQFRVSAP